MNGRRSSCWMIKLLGGSGCEPSIFQQKSDPQPWHFLIRLFSRRAIYGLSGNCGAGAGDHVQLEGWVRHDIGEGR